MLGRALWCGSLGRRIQHVLNGGNAGDRLFCEDSQLQRQRAREFAIKIDGAAAHSRDYTSVFDLRPLQLYEDDGLFGPEKIFKNADNLKVELFHLIAGKNCVRVSLHACPYLAEGKNFVRFLGEGDARPRAKCRRERQECEEQQARRLG